ncbi:MAG: RNA degradosome polyphosphate kinase, partial [Candidatus Eremiobacteraeota bacterium]|nr:RNA degradosome polyphosphate kinase [Candidatus Eremiobacteraeota bacterium]
RIILDLYRASQAGVPIEVIVRGMCKLRPGMPGMSETISVRSIVGRFLEHSRIYIFENGGNREVYIGSADLMGRNLDRRVETIVPVLDRPIAGSIVDEIFATLAADNQKARIMRTDGSYERRQVQTGETPSDAQRTFLARVATPTAPADGAPARG